MNAPIVVFDLDGTLVDSAPNLIATLNVVLAADGLPQIEFSRAMRLLGAGIRPLIERALGVLGVAASEDRMDALHAHFLRHYGAHIAEGALPYPGVEPALDALAGRGILLAVCTNKDETLATRLLDALSLSRRFATICGCDTFGMRKPHPDVLLKTIGRAGGDMRRAVMVGDSETDVRLARAAAIPVVGVDFGYTPVPMGELGPDRCIGHFDALEQAVMELFSAQDCGRTQPTYG